jgi:hypothetical protein
MFRKRVRNLCRASGKYDLDLRPDGKALFRDVFLGTPKGKQVLELLMHMLHMFDDSLESEEELICTNIGRKILRACGVWEGRKSLHIVEVLANVGFTEVNDGNDS